VAYSLLSGLSGIGGEGGPFQDTGGTHGEMEPSLGGVLLSGAFSLSHTLRLDSSKSGTFTLQFGPLAYWCS